MDEDKQAGQQSQWRPSATSTAHTLPFDKLSPRDFERLSLWLVEREGYERAEHLGAAGSEQGRDLVAWRDAELWAFQCKRVKSFTPQQALAEVDKILTLPAAQRPMGLVFIVTCDVSANARQQARDRCQQHGLACRFWTGTELDEKVKGHPDILAEFFGIRGGGLNWMAVAVAVLLVTIGGLFVYGVVAWWPPPPMGNGFNVAVAEFSVLDDSTSPEIGLEFSEWLFEAIVKEVDQLPAALRVDTRGPQDIGVIEGLDRETRRQNAAEVAEKHNATILIYGVISNDDDGSRVQPEFFVRSEGFDYGSEVAGYEQLGHPIPIDTALDPGKRFELNEKLNARAQALQHLVAGLANFFVRRYDDAVDDFRRAVEVDGWPPEEGKEVAYLLLGAGYLRGYDEITNRDPLPEAEAAFRQAYELNPNYGRSYLGLGAVTLEQAKILNEDETGIGGADEEKLVEAANWYSKSLRTTEQPVTAYLPAKAAYGLGQVHLLGFEERVPGWSGQKAEDFFNKVLVEYEANPIPELAWFAARSQAYLGRIAGHKGQWETMSAQVREAIDRLSELPGATPRHLIARYWAWVAIAEEQQGRLDDSRDAYRQAIEYGQGSVSPQELDKWQKELGRLEKGAP